MPRRARWVVFAICASSVLLVGVDQSIVIIALPAIGSDLRGDIAWLEWVVDAYVTAAAALLITAGVLADRFGRRRVFQVGLGVFAAGSLLCAAAPTVEALVAARVVQGCGAAALVPVGLAIVATVARDARERAHMIGAWGAAFGISLAAGPLIGGLLLTTAGWRPLFWVNVPIALAAIVLCGFAVPETRADRPRRLDPLGQALLIVLLGAVVMTIIEAPRGRPEITAGAALLAVLAAAGLVLAARRRPETLLPPVLFHRRAFVAALGAATAVFAALAVTLVSGSLALQQADGRTALEAAFALTPVALAAAALAPASGALVARTGPARSLLLAAGSILAGGGLLAFGSATAIGGCIVAGYLAIGAGFGLANAPITTTALAGLPGSQTGAAAAIAATARQAGAAVGTAVGGLVALVPEPLVLAGVVIAALGVPVAVAGATRAARPQHAEEAPTP